MASNAPETVTDEEDELITNAFIATSNALGDAIIALKRIEAITFDHDELDDIILERRELEDEAAANERSFLAYIDGEIALHPPSAEDVKEIVRVAGELAILTQKRTTAQAVLDLANIAIAKFEEVRGIN
jgi:hypothetical protein